MMMMMWFVDARRRVSSERHGTDLIELQTLGTDSNLFFDCADGQFLADPTALGRFGRLARFDSFQQEDTRNVGVAVLGQIAVDPERRCGGTGGAKGPNVHKAVVVELATKRLEVARVEILGQNRLGKGIGRVQNQQPPPPFHYSRVLLRLKHVVQPTNKLVESHARRRRQNRWFRAWTRRRTNLGRLTLSSIPLEETRH